MRRIVLSDTLLVMIDDEDFDLIKDYNWQPSKSGSRFYARTFVMNATEPKKRKSLFLQHLIVGKVPKGKRLSFKDGNALNCQRSNLEFISYAEAAHKYYKKIKKNKNTNQPFKGVIVQYIARIKHNNKLITLGSFTNEKDAARAYNEKVKELYGDKAILNNL